MSGGRPEDLLPSISQLLQQAGALERSQTVDVSAVARQPVFQSDVWKEAISEFLRWSGSTLDPASGVSVYELLLSHGKAGGLALYNVFREDLLRRDATAGSAGRKLAAVRTIASMASRWLHETDWDLDDAPRLSPEDFAGGKSERAVISLSPELSNRLRTALTRVHPRVSPSDFVEKLVAEEVAELEGGTKGGNFGPKPAGENGVEVRRPASPPPPRSFFSAEQTARGMWKKAPEEPGSPPSLRVPPGPKPPTTRY